jgi:hypothetical protein
MRETLSLTGALQAPTKPSGSRPGSYPARQGPQARSQRRTRRGPFPQVPRVPGPQPSARTTSFCRTPRSTRPRFRCSPTVRGLQSSRGGKPGHEGSMRKDARNPRGSFISWHPAASPFADASPGPTIPRTPRPWVSTFAESASTGDPSREAAAGAAVQVLFPIRSERMLMEQLDYNLLCRWFWVWTTLVAVMCTGDRLTVGRRFRRNAESAFAGRLQARAVVITAPARAERQVQLRCRQRVGERVVRVVRRKPRSARPSARPVRDAAPPWLSGARRRRSCRLRSRSTVSITRGHGQGAARAAVGLTQEPEVGRRVVEQQHALARTSPGRASCGAEGASNGGRLSLAHSSSCGSPPSGGGRSRP